MVVVERQPARFAASRVMDLNFIYRFIFRVDLWANIFIFMWFSCEWQVASMDRGLGMKRTFCSQRNLYISSSVEFVCDKGDVLHATWAPSFSWSSNLYFCVLFQCTFYIKLVLISRKYDFDKISMLLNSVELPWWVDMAMPNPCHFSCSKFTSNRVRQLKQLYHHRPPLITYLTT